MFYSTVYTADNNGTCNCKFSQLTGKAQLGAPERLAQCTTAALWPGEGLGSSA